MKIGLVRHFKVDHQRLDRLTSKDYLEWGYAYDVANVIPNETDLRGIKWDKCYASDLRRAIITAETIYPGTVEQTPLLREVRNFPILQTERKKRHRFWSVAGRIAWFMGHASQLESKVEIQTRIRVFLDGLETQSNQNILIVSHAFFMHALKRELLKRGFHGDRFVKAQNGVLYLFEKV